jgi:hypothetical protein
MIQDSYEEEEIIQLISDKCNHSDISNILIEKYGAKSGFSTRPV